MLDPCVQRRPLLESSRQKRMSTALLSREEELHWLALKLIPGLGTRTSNKLLDRFRSPQAIFRASRTELEGAGVSGAVAQSIASGSRLITSAGLEVLRVRADPGPAILKNRRPGRIALRVGLRALGLVPAFRYQFIFVMRKP